MFPAAGISATDVESSWAGIRPLIHEDEKQSTEISRKDEIWEDETGVITIAGGKLTGYRIMTERVVDLVAKRIYEWKKSLFNLAEQKFIGFGLLSAAPKLACISEEKQYEALQAGLSKEAGKSLAETYGTNIDCIFFYIRQYKEDNVGEFITAVDYAKLMYAIYHEMAVKPVDFLIRRTGGLYFDINWVKGRKIPIIDIMGREFGWTKEEKQHYLHELNLEILHASKPVDE